MPGSIPACSANDAVLGQIPVVGQSEPGPDPPPGTPAGRWSSRWIRRACRVPGVTDGQVATQTRELALVEHGGDQTHVLHHGDGVAIADRHAGRLLAVVLEGEQPVKGEGVRQIAPGRRPRRLRTLPWPPSSVDHRTHRGRRSLRPSPRFSHTTASASLHPRAGPRTGPPVEPPTGVRGPSWDPALLRVPWPERYRFPHPLRRLRW